MISHHQNCFTTNLNPHENFNLFFHEALQTPQKSIYHHPITPESTKHKSFSEIKKFKKTVWKKEEDDLLMTQVAEKGPNQWAEIASFLPNRSGKQCRERWHNHLRSGVTKEAWDIKEYWILALCVQAFGRRWSIISEFIPGRSDNTIKNQWNCKMKPYKEDFQRNIERLIKHPECWDTLTKQEKILLDKISRIKPKESQGQRYEFLKIIDVYNNMIETGLSAFLIKKKNLTFETNKEYLVKQEGNEIRESKEGKEVKQEREEEVSHVYPGDLSDVISVGDYFFYDSEEENPITPTPRKK